MLLVSLLALIGLASAEEPIPSAPAEVPPADAVAPPPASVPVAPAADAAQPGGVVVDRVAAVVNEEIITLSEVYAFGGSYIDEVVKARGPTSREAAEGEVLERLLERRLVSQEMTALKLDLADQDVERSIADIAERNGLDVDGLRKEVERSGMAWDQYRSELEENLRDMRFAQTVLRPRINVTEDELRDAWLRASPAATASARLEAIEFSLPPEATEAEREAVFARAREIRANPSSTSAEKGEAFQELGVFKPGETGEAIDAVVVSSPVGEVSEPILIGDKVYLIRVAERITGSNDFEARRDEVAEQVFQSRLADEKERWFQEARRRASIRILLPGVSGSGSTPGAAPIQ